MGHVISGSNSSRTSRISRVPALAFPVLVLAVRSLLREVRASMSLPAVFGRIGVLGDFGSDSGVSTKARMR
jgi:hypothetical protein